MLSSIYGDLLATVALGGTVALMAAALHALLRWRERLRPGALAPVPVHSRRHRPDGAERSHPTPRSES
jgi:hypothetical protein